MTARLKVNNSGVKTQKDSDSVSSIEAKEVIKCAKDASYFIQNYVKVQHSTLGSVLFKFRKYQKRTLKNLVKNKQNIILAPRQSGKTIGIVAYILWYTIFNNDKIIGVASNKQASAKDIISRFRFAYEELPLFLKPAVVSYNKFDIEFDNGSKIMSAATTENTFRGRSLSLLFLDEFAFVPPRIAEEFWTSILPTISTGGAIIITSTPNGSEGIFADVWFKSEQELNSFKPTRIYNSEVPGRGKKFKKEMLEKMTEEQYSQEFDAAFISTKGTLISSSFLESLSYSAPKKLIDELFVYSDIYNKRLGVSVDVGTGCGKDYSVIQVFNIDTLEQVAEYRDNTLIQTEFTRKFISILEYLDKEGAKEIYFTIESNSIGLGVIRLIEVSTNSIFNKAEFIHDKRRHESGMLTTSKSKMDGAMRFKDLVEKNKIKINSKDLISELRFFVKSGVSFKAETGKTDDLVMACIIFSNMLTEISSFDENIYNELNNIDGFVFDDNDQSGPLPFI